MKLNCTSGVAVGMLLLLALPSNSYGMRWPWKWNQLDKDGNRHGRWRSYQEVNGTQMLFNQGRYKHGKEIGRWKTYGPSGELYMTEKVEPAKMRMKTTYYHPNGKVSHTGMAYQFEKDKFWKYTLHGDWKYYDTTGQLLGIKTYLQGKVIADTTPNKEQLPGK